MKYFRYLPLLVSLAIALPAYAATITVSPSAVPVVAGQQVTFTVSIDAQDGKVVTVKDAMTYPSAILSTPTFSFAPSWIQLVVPGYDAAANGTVIKTAGYPRGFTGTKQFGTVTFTARGAGVATLTVTPSSHIYNPQGVDIFTQAAAAPHTNTALGNTAGAPSIPGTLNLATASGTQASTSANIETQNSSNQPAAAAEALGTKWGAAVRYGILALIVVTLLGGSWWLYNRRKAE